VAAWAAAQAAGCGPLEPLIGSFALHLATEGKAARTLQGYTSAVRWFAAAYLLCEPGKTSWEQVNAQDIQRWMTQLLHRYSSAYASIQFRALQHFFRWRSEEEELPDPMARLRAPKVTVMAVPVFTSVELLGPVPRFVLIGRQIARYVTHCRDQRCTSGGNIAVAKTYGRVCWYGSDLTFEFHSFWVIEPPAIAQTRSRTSWVSATPHSRVTS
jgi:hypothetical protein